MRSNRLTLSLFALIHTLIFANFSLTPAQVTPEDPFHGLPAGTKIKVRMDNGITSKSSSVDDTFTVTVTEPVLIEGVVMLDSGTVIEGRITTVDRSAIGRKDGSIEVLFETLYIDEANSRKIEAVMERAADEGDGKVAEVLTIAGGALAGGLLGRASGAQNGVLLGSGIGAGIGIGASILKKGSEFRIKAGEEFEVRLTKPVSLPVRGY